MIAYLKLKLNRPIKNEKDFCDMFSMGAFRATLNTGREIAWDFTDTEYLLDPGNKGDNSIILIKEYGIDKSYEDGERISLKDIKNIITFNEIYINHDNSINNHVESIEHLAMFDDDGQGIMFSKMQFEAALCIG